MKTNTSQSLAAKITRRASKQTYYTIRLLVDRELVPDAYRAYAYFRWVDDCLDDEMICSSERLAFLNRQQSLLEACYRHEPPGDLSAEEEMLVDLVKNDGEDYRGLQSYLRNMMAVMEFDVERRGRLIRQAELSEYSRSLATAVTDALHYFIGHNCSPPDGNTRYIAVRGAHVVHMLRDMVEDTANGYFNIPIEYLETHALSPNDVNHQSYRMWVFHRVQLARTYFGIGRNYLTQVKNPRCRLAGFAYIARFEWTLNTIVRDGYRLRAAYPQRKSPLAGLWMVWNMFSSILGLHMLKTRPQQLAIQPLQYDEP
jgi:phytoene/squalene synthetase